MFFSFQNSYENYIKNFLLFQAKRVLIWWRFQAGRDEQMATGWLLKKGLTKKEKGHFIFLI